MNAPKGLNESLRPYLCDLRHLWPPSPWVTLAQVTFHLFLCQIQPTISISLGSRTRLGGWDNLGGRLVSPHQLQAG